MMATVHGRRGFVIAALAGTLALLVPLQSLAAPPADNSSERDVTVMTQNMDEGTDFGFLAGPFPTPTAFVIAVSQTYLEVQSTDIPGRAAALAREIAAAQPDLIGLQEVALWRTGPFNPGVTTPSATTVAFDSLKSLLDALKALGLHYAPIAVQNELDVEAPTINLQTGAPSMNVRATDRNALLARTDRKTSELKLANVQMHNYTATLPFPTPGGTIEVTRGWISVDAKVRGKEFRFVTTHLEAAAGGIQVLQGNELVQAQAGAGMPVVFAGDFNSAAPGGSPDVTPTYGNLIAAGYADAWSTAHPGDPGYTWGLYKEDPLLTPATPSERIDLILTRGDIGVRVVRLVGKRNADRLSSGLSPSDHAGVVATLHIAPDCREPGDEQDEKAGPSRPPRCD